MDSIHRTTTISCSTKTATLKVLSPQTLADDKVCVLKDFLREARPMSVSTLIRWRRQPLPIDDAVFLTRTITVSRMEGWRHVIQMVLFTTLNRRHQRQDILHETHQDLHPNMSLDRIALNDNWIVQPFKCRTISSVSAKIRYRKIHLISLTTPSLATKMMSLAQLIWLKIFYWFRKPGSHPRLRNITWLLHCPNRLYTFCHRHLIERLIVTRNLLKVIFDHFFEELYN